MTTPAIPTQDQARSNSVITWPAPEGEVPSPDFAVQAGETSLFTYQAPVRAEILKKEGLWSHKPDYRSQRASFVIFDMTRPVAVKVRPTRPFATAKILPERAGIVATVTDGVVEFTLTKPGKLTLLLDGDDRTALHLFAGEPERDVPLAKDPNVLYFGPGVHETTGIELKSGQTVYLAGGAILRAKPKAGDTGTYNDKWKVTFFHGSVFTLKNVNNVTVRGRGIIDSSLVPHPGFNTFGFNGARNVRIEGVMLRNAANWNFTIGKSEDVEIRDVRIISGRLNTDGINSVSSRRVHIHDCFVRNHDDSIVVKTTAADSISEDILVENCTVWNDWGFALGVSYETRAPIRNVTFRDNAIIHAEHWCLGVYLSDSATVENIKFINTSISDLSAVKHEKGSAAAALGARPLLLRAAIVKDVWGHDAERGRIRNVTIDGVVIHGSTLLASELKGADAEHDVRGVTFRNIRLLGRKPVVDWEGLNAKKNEFVSELTITAD